PDVNELVLSPDGSRLAGVEDSTARVRDLFSGRVLREFREHRDKVDGLAFGPDGRHILSTSQDRTTRLWEADSGVERLVLVGSEDGAGTVALSPDGRRLAGVVGLKSPESMQSRVRLWDTSDGKPAGTLRGHAAVVRCLAFSPDGRRLASAAADGTVHV